MVFPAVLGPEVGLIRVIAGGPTYVKPSFNVPEPLAVVTFTSAEPCAPAGVLAISVELFTKLTPVAFAPPIVTDELLVNPEPEMVMLVPPEIDPEDGVTETMVGGAGGGARVVTRPLVKPETVCHWPSVSPANTRIGVGTRLPSASAALPVKV